MKTGTIITGENVAVISTSATSTAPIFVIGYSSVRGDSPNTLSTRPLLSIGANTFLANAFWHYRYIGTSGTPASPFTLDVGSTIAFCSFRNTSTSTARNGILLSSSASGNNRVLFCDAGSQNGNAISGAAGDGHVIQGNYIHDSDIGVVLGSGSLKTSIIGNIFRGIDGTAISETSTTTSGTYISNNTIYGFGTARGIGSSLGAGMIPSFYTRNIFKNLTTGITQATAQQATNMGLQNLFHNNKKVQ